MQQHPKNILLEILTIIDYEDDKEAFADEFLTNCEKQAFLNLIGTLPPERREAIKQRLEEATDTEQVKAILSADLSPQAYTDALKKVSQIALSELIDTVSAELSAYQRAKLRTFTCRISSFRPSPRGEQRMCARS